MFHDIKDTLDVRIHDGGLDDVTGVAVGKDKRGDELPDWTGDKQKRLAKIQQAMAARASDRS